MSNPLDSLLPPDDGGKKRPSSSSYSRDPGGGRGGPRDVWGNPRDPKKEEVKEESSEYHRGGSSSTTSTSRYRTGPGATAPSFSTPAQRAGGGQGYKREYDGPKREYDQYGAPDSKRRHEGASSSQYIPREGPPDSFYAVSRIGVQLNSWGLDISEMDECIKKVLFEVTLVAGEKRHKLSDGIPMMKGDVNTQLKRLSSCVIFNKWCQMNPDVFRGKSDSNVAAYDAADTVYISASHLTPNLQDQDVKLTKKDFTEQEWKIVNQISRRRDTEFEIRIRSIGEVYTRGDQALGEKNRSELTRCLEAISNQILHTERFFNFPSGTYPVQGGVLNEPDAVTEIKSGFSKVSKVVAAKSGQPEAILTVDTASSPFFKATSVLKFVVSKLQGGGGRGGFGGRGGGRGGFRGGRGGNVQPKLAALTHFLGTQGQPLQPQKVYSNDPRLVSIPRPAGTIHSSGSMQGSRSASLVLAPNPSPPTIQKRKGRKDSKDKNSGGPKRNRLQEIKKFCTKPTVCGWWLCLLLAVVVAIIIIIILTQVLPTPKEAQFNWNAPLALTNGQNSTSKIDMKVEKGDRIRFQIQGAPPIKGNYINYYDFNQNQVIVIDQSLNANGKNLYCFILPLDRSSMPNAGDVRKAAKSSVLRRDQTDGWQQVWSWIPAPMQMTSSVSVSRSIDKIHFCTGSLWKKVAGPKHVQPTDPRV
ncbi:unnamed protein product [Caenorhabditis brenneri]